MNVMGVKNVQSCGFCIIVTPFLNKILADIINVSPLLIHFFFKSGRHFSFFSFFFFFLSRKMTWFYFQSSILAVLVVWTTGEDGMDWENRIETYTLTYVKLDSQWKFAVWHMELKSRALWLFIFLPTNDLCPLL